LPINLIILANTHYHRDFRKYLMRAAERSGGSALHVLFREKVTFSWAGAQRVDYSTSANCYALAQIIRGRLQPGPILGLIGLGGTRLDEAAGKLAADLHQQLSDVHWVYDVFDDFLYNAEGEDRVRRLMADAVWRCRCERSIILDPGLRGRYPSAVHLDNASHLQLLQSAATADPSRMGYIGSIDRRVDFDWLDALADNNVTIDIFGSVHIVAAAETQQKLDALIERRRNVSFHGPYDNDDLPDILAQFGVGLLPYRVGHPMTDHVNPDKLHHYLNAGLAVVASPIPAARRLGRYIHVMATGGDWAGLLNELESNRLQESWPRESNTWDRRWAELVELVLPDEAANLTPQVARRVGALSHP
jgi:hypothetical protein